MGTEQALLVFEVLEPEALASSPELAATWWAVHDRQVRDLLAACGGREIDKTDGLLALFDRAAAALDFAQRCQRALAAAPVPARARAGLHVGPVILRENPAADVALGAKPLEVEGLAKPTAARVMALARPGQTLLTEAARGALAGAGGPLQSHGHWLFKGLREPLEVFEPRREGEPACAPADGEKAVRVLRDGDTWRPVREIAHNLPHPASSFVGRAQALQEVLSRLLAGPLLTLTGAGGCGKTRLALQVARDALPHFPGGAWLVELAALSDPRGVPQRVAEVLGVAEQPGTDLLDSLAGALAGRRRLLLLDNAEHLLGACSALTTALRQRCPQATLLVTSREAMGVPGESTFRVPSMAVPDEHSSATPAAMARCEAVQLFVARAAAQLPGFALDAHNAAPVASVCRRLDGIPFALELAAARLRSLPLDELNARLDQRFRLLTGGARTALPRQQTLRALIDWSHELLDPTEQALLRRLSVFAGGWTLEAACAVGASEDLAAEAVPGVLHALQEKSLVSNEPAGPGAMRWRLLETVRHYARERLVEAGEGETARSAHLSHFLALALAAEPQLRGADQGAWLQRLAAEHDNLRAALEWSLAPGVDRVAGLRLAGALFKYWYVRCHYGEGRAWFERLLERAAEAPAALRESALAGASVMAWQQGDYGAARRLGAEGLALARTLADEATLASALMNLGVVAFSAGELESARVHFEEGLALRRRLGHQRGVAGALHNLAAVESAAGRLQVAERLFEEALALYSGQADTWGRAITLSNLAALLARAGQHERARHLQCESLRLRHELLDRNGVAESMDGLAGDLARRRSPLRAARLWAAAQRLREELGAAPLPAECAERERQVAAARSALADDAAFEAAWQAGRALAVEAAVEEALQPAA